MNNLLLSVGLGVLAAVVTFIVLDRFFPAQAGEAVDGDVPGGNSAQLDQLRRENRWAQEILERMAEGVLVLDESAKPLSTNSAGRDLMGFHEDMLPARLPSGEVLELAEKALAEGVSREALASVWFPARMSLWARAAPLQDGSGVVVVLQDVTNEIGIQRARREFVAHASHELKSPVAALRTLAEAIRRAVHEDPDMAEHFSTRLTAEAERLGRLIEDLLDLTKLEEAATPPDQRIDLSEVAQSEADRFETPASAAGTSFERHIHPGVWIMGDEGQLGTMIRNLLENAFHYTPREGRVTIEVSERGGNALVEVGDTGIGIPLEAQSRVFERFYRVDRGRSRDSGGTGLGLAIAKHVIELHGGHIQVESELGQGSTFTARIPSAAPEQGTVRSLAG
ncbi:MAG: two-component sensor histidine kinase [Actinobacteria bacterium]|nr:two-component sensor histidine kinase [Actinomycetota bacterium]